MASSLSGVSDLLLEIRILGSVTDEALAVRHPEPSDHAALVSALGEAASAQLVERRGRRQPAWMLTPSGRVHLTELLAADLDQREARSALEGLYRRFEPLNRRLHRVCTQWQLREGTRGWEPNTHDDAAYDATVIETLLALHQDLLPWGTEVAASLPRMGRHLQRLAGAAEQIRAGESEWIDAVTCDSYHGVWFEMHEDLLATLGLERDDVEVDDRDLIE